MVAEHAGGHGLRRRVEHCSPIFGKGVEDELAQVLAREEGEEEPYKVRLVLGEHVLGYLVVLSDPVGSIDNVRVHAKDSGVAVVTENVVVKPVPWIPPQKTTVH